LKVLYPKLCPEGGHSFRILTQQNRQSNRGRFAARLRPETSAGPHTQSDSDWRSDNQMPNFPGEKTRSEGA